MLLLDQAVPADPRFPLSGPELMEIFEGLAAAFGSIRTPRKRARRSMISS